MQSGEGQREVERTFWGSMRSTVPRSLMACTSFFTSFTVHSCAAVARLIVSCVVSCRVSCVVSCRVVSCRGGECECRGAGEEGKRRSAGGGVLGALLFEGVLVLLDPLQELRTRLTRARGETWPR
jgi:hypothetical protein